MSTQKRNVIDPSIKKHIENEITLSIQDLMAQHENYKEKQSILWYDSINASVLKLFAEPPKYLISTIKNNPYVISRSVTVSAVKSETGVTNYLVKFYVHNKLNWITKINSHIYHLKKKRPILFAFLSVLYYISCIYALFYIYFLFNPS